MLDIFVDPNQKGMQTKRLRFIFDPWFEGAGPDHIARK